MRPQHTRGRGGPSHGRDHSASSAQAFDGSPSPIASAAAAVAVSPRTNGNGNGGAQQALRSLKHKHQAWATSGANAASLGRGLLPPTDNDHLASPRAAASVPSSQLSSPRDSLETPQAIRSPRGQYQHDHGSISLTYPPQSPEHLYQQHLQPQPQEGSYFATFLLEQQEEKAATPRSPSFHSARRSTRPMSLSFVTPPTSPLNQRPTHARSASHASFPAARAHSVPVDEHARQTVSTRPFLQSGTGRNGAPSAPEAQRSSSTKKSPRFHPVARVSDEKHASSSSLGRQSPAPSLTRTQSLSQLHSPRNGASSPRKDGPHHRASSSLSQHARSPSPSTTPNDFLAHFFSPVSSTPATFDTVTSVANYAYPSPSAALVAAALTPRPGAHPLPRRSSPQGQSTDANSNLDTSVVTMQSFESTTSPPVAIMRSPSLSAPATPTLFLAQMEIRLRALSKSMSPRSSAAGSAPPHAALHKLHRLKQDVGDASVWMKLLKSTTETLAPAPPLSPNSNAANAPDARLVRSLHEAATKSVRKLRDELELPASKATEDLRQAARSLYDALMPSSIVNPRDASTQQLVAALQQLLALVQTSMPLVPPQPIVIVSPVTSNSTSPTLSSSTPAETKEPTDAPLSPVDEATPTAVPDHETNDLANEAPTAESASNESIAVIADSVAPSTTDNAPEPSHAAVIVETSSPIVAISKAALFDFAAPDVGQLAFKVGDLLTIHADADAKSGWLAAENCEGTRGFVPENYVELRPSAAAPIKSLAAVEDTSARSASQPENDPDGATSSSAAALIDASSLPSPDDASSSPPDAASSSSPPLAITSGSIVTCLWDFAGQEPGQLAFRSQDTLRVIEAAAGGWILAEHVEDGRRGFVPEGYVKLKTEPLAEASSSPPLVGSSSSPSATPRRKSFAIVFTPREKSSSQDDPTQTNIDESADQSLADEGFVDSEHTHFVVDALASELSAEAEEAIYGPKLDPPVFEDDDDDDTMHLVLLQRQEQPYSPFPLFPSLRSRYNRDMGADMVTLSNRLMRLADGRYKKEPTLASILKLVDANGIVDPAEWPQLHNELDAHVEDLAKQHFVENPQLELARESASLRERELRFEEADRALAQSRASTAAASSSSSALAHVPPFESASAPPPAALRRTSLSNSSPASSREASAIIAERSDDDDDVPIFSRPPTQTVAASSLPDDEPSTPPPARSAIWSPPTSPLRQITPRVSRTGASPRTPTAFAYMARLETFADEEKQAAKEDDDDEDDTIVIKTDGVTEIEQFDSAEIGKDEPAMSGGQQSVRMIVTPAPSPASSTSSLSMPSTPLVPGSFCPPSPGAPPSIMRGGSLRRLSESATGSPVLTPRKTVSWALDALQKLEALPSSVTQTTTPRTKLGPLDEMGLPPPQFDEAQ